MSGAPQPGGVGDRERLEERMALRETSVPNRRQLHDEGRSRRLEREWRAKPVVCEHERGRRRALTEKSPGTFSPKMVFSRRH